MATNQTKNIVFCFWKLRVLTIEVFCLWKVHILIIEVLCLWKLNVLIIEMSLPKSVYNPDWSDKNINPDFAAWVREVTNDPYSAYCSFCKKKKKN